MEWHMDGINILLDKKNMAYLRQWLFSLFRFLHIGLSLATEAILEKVPQGKNKVLKPMLS
jgi:hypothetical protein